MSFLFFLVSIGLIQYFLHLVYANLILATDGYHQLTGYAGHFLAGNGNTSLFSPTRSGLSAPFWPIS